MECQAERLRKRALEAVSEPLEYDHEASDVEEGLVDVKVSLVSDDEAAEVSEPCVGSFDLPAFAVASEAAPILSGLADSV